MKEDTRMTTQTWHLDRDLLVIIEDGPDGLALFEVLSATSFADAYKAAAAPEMYEALQRIAADIRDNVGDIGRIERLAVDALAAADGE